MTPKFQLNEKCEYGGKIFVIQRITFDGKHVTYDILEYASFNNISLLNIAEEKLEKI